jgi:hypothetical protein
MYVREKYSSHFDVGNNVSFLLIHVVCGPMVEIYHSSYSKYYVAVVTMITYVVVIVIAPDVQLINTDPMGKRHYTFIACW